MRDPTTGAARLTATAAIVGQLCFTGAWAILGQLEGPGYSPARHFVSDLGAVTARHGLWMIASQGVAGVTTMAFGLSLRSSLRSESARSRGLGAWLVLGSIVAIDNVSDVFFRLDCRAMDPGCASHPISWHAGVHTAVGGVSILATLWAPFALAPEMRRVPGWIDVARFTVACGWVTAGCVAALGLLNGHYGAGLAQRALLLAASLLVVRLARRARAIDVPGGMHWAPQ